MQTKVSGPIEWQPVTPGFFIQAGTCRSRAAKEEKLVGLLKDSQKHSGVYTVWDLFPVMPAVKEDTARVRLRVWGTTWGTAPKLEPTPKLYLYIYIHIWYVIHLLHNKIDHCIIYTLFVFIHLYMYICIYIHIMLTYIITYKCLYIGINMIPFSDREMWEFPHLTGLKDHQPGIEVIRMEFQLGKLTGKTRPYVALEKPGSFKIYKFS